MFVRNHEHYVLWSVDVLNVAQVSSEIGWPAFLITPSEASNGSQCAIKCSLGGCECRWTWTSAVFVISTIFCACINKKAALLIYLKYHSVCAWLLRAYPTVRNTKLIIMCSSAPARNSCRERDAAREPLERKKTTGYMSETLWLLSF